MNVTKEGEEDEDAHLMQHEDCLWLIRLFAEHQSKKEMTIISTRHIWNDKQYQMEP